MSTASKKKRKRRIAAYCRVSTASDDQLMSLEAQKTHYEECITANPDWEYADLNYDEGITSTKKEIQLALLKLIADCEDGTVEYIVTKSLFQDFFAGAFQKVLAKNIPSILVTLW